MLLLLISVLNLFRVELGIFALDFLLDQTGVAHTDVVIGTAGDLLAQVLQSLCRRSKLSHLLDLKAFSLLAHVLKEHGKVGRNAVGTL